jgi:hypothetical protein
MRSADGEVEVDVVARTDAQLSATSHFATVGEASAFFEGGGIGYSVTKSGNRLDGCRPQDRFMAGGTAGCRAGLLDLL